MKVLEKVTFKAVEEKKMKTTREGGKKPRGTAGEKS